MEFLIAPPVSRVTADRIILRISASILPPHFSTFISHTSLQHVHRQQREERGPEQ